MEEMLRIPVVLYRGGTSKAIFIKENDLSADPETRDRLICAIFGSPDKRQIDGLGGADPLTSKVAIIGPPSRSDADVDYTFGQVDILSPRVTYFGVCGNISAAVGPYAIEEGFVRVEDPLTKVRIHSTNIGRIIEASVPTPNRRVTVFGNFAIDGVPGTGAKIELDWSKTVGARTGALLPTGNPRDILNIPGLNSITVSIIDVGNPGVFIKAEDLGLRGTEGPDVVDSRPELIKMCETIADAASKKAGAVMRLSFVSPPQNYSNYLTGNEVKSDEVDYLVRMIFMGKLHKAYAASLLNCCGAAAIIPGTVVNEVARTDLSKRGKVRMGHPSGIAELEVSVDKSEGELHISKLVVYRTARRLMEGYVLIKRDIIG